MSELQRDYSTSVLFEFDTLVDLEIGVIKALQEDFSPEGLSPFINYSFLHGVSTEDLKLHHIYDLDERPLEQCFIGEAKKNFLKFYVDYINEDYERIIKLSPTTSMLTLIRMYVKSKFITPYVICHSDLEVDTVNKITRGDARTILVHTEKEINLKDYARLIISNITDVLKFKEVECLHIAVLNYGQNFTVIDESRTLLPHIMVALDEINEFEVIDAYANLNTPLG